MYSHCDLYGGEGCGDMPTYLIITVVVLIGMFLYLNRKKLMMGEKSELFKLIGILVAIIGIGIVVPLITKGLF